MTAAFGLDVGGTKIEIAALVPDGRELLRRRCPTPDGYAALLDAMAGLVDAVEVELGERGTVGVCHPGTISPATGRVKNSNRLWLNGESFDRDLARHLDRPVALANDANCFALSEATDGAGAGARTVFGVIIGTGVGGGVVIDGRLLTGADGIAGEWGHIGLGRPRPDELPGPDCYCGLAGCIESYLSGGGFAADHARRTGQALAAPEIAARAGTDPECRRSLELYADRLARSLATVIDLIDPDVVVLGGGMSNVDLLYELVPPQLGQWIFSDRVVTDLRPARHGDSSGVRGAAWLGATTANGRRPG